MIKLATIWRPFGALLIGVVWIALSFFLTNERNSADRAAIQNSTNLAGALDRCALASCRASNSSEDRARHQASAPGVVEIE